MSFFTVKWVIFLQFVNTTLWEITTPSTELPRDSCAGIGPLVPLFVLGKLGKIILKQEQELDV